MQIVIEKEALEKMLKISLYAITGADYDDVKIAVDELLNTVNYIKLPKDHGRLIDADAIPDSLELKGFLSQDDMHLVPIGQVKEILNNARIIVGADDGSNY